MRQRNNPAAKLADDGLAEHEINVEPAPAPLIIVEETAATSDLVSRPPLRAWRHRCPGAIAPPAEPDMRFQPQTEGNTEEFMNAAPNPLKVTVEEPVFDLLGRCRYGLLRGGAIFTDERVPA